MKRIRLRVSLVLAGMAALAVASVCGAQGPEPLEENWYALYLTGQKAGYQHEVIVEEPGADAPHYRTEIHTEFALMRAAMPMRFVVDTMVREDAEGRVTAFRQAIRGPMSFTNEGHVEDGEMAIKIQAGGAVTTARVPAHDGLGPWALRCLQKRMGHEPGTTYEAKAFVPDSPGTPVGLTVTVTGQEDVQVYEVTKRLHRADSRIDILPGLTSSEWFDDSGTVWLAKAALPGNLVLESRKATKALATAPDDPADILAASFIRPDKAIPRPRELGRLRMLLKPLAGDADGLGLQSGPFQQVEPTDEGLVVTLTRAAGTPDLSYKLPYEGTEHAPLQRPNVWMESDNEVIRQMAREAVGDETDALAAARRIERYVREAITVKDLSLGFATAVEAAEQKAGDCTEHAVLAAAMARAAGMPSRVVGGLVYADLLPGVQGGGFGYHMWAEVFVGEWLPVDAALGGHDATHLALVRSGLNGPDDLFAISAAICRFFGAVAVEVLETE